MTLNSITELLFVALCGSWFLLARNLWRIFFVGERRRWLDAAEFAIGSVAICCIVVDLLDISRVRFFGAQFMLANLGCMLFIISFVWLLTKLLSPTTRLCTANGRMTSWFLAFLAIAMGAWTFSRLQDRSSLSDMLGVGGVAPGVIVSEDEFCGRTDLGSKINLFHFSVDDQLFKEYAEDFHIRYSMFTSALIHREDADSSSNCHGWVFTGGKFLLRGTGVERILEENRYAIVSTPAPGDIVIYRSDTGAILHTGLVQGVLNEGTVMIESKWGTDQRFLHRPEDQPYSTSFVYYHSDRKGHLIDLEQSTGSDFEDD